MTRIKVEAKYSKLLDKKQWPMEPLETSVQTAPYTKTDIKLVLMRFISMLVSF